MFEIIFNGLRIPIIDGLSEAIDSISPYIYDWDSETVEDDLEHVIAVVGFDIQGNSTLATPIAVFIDNFDNVVPTGQILNPIPGQTVNGTVTIEITAHDNIGVANVEVSIDGIPRVAAEPIVFQSICS
jgi:hypothetical protein